LAVSGGSLNPAVSLALLAAKKLSVTEALLYCAAELLGATAAGLALVSSLPSAFGRAAGWGAPALASVGPGSGILLEFLMTLFLAMVIFWTAVAPNAPKVGGFAIGLAVMADILFGGAFTGAAMNPARAIGPMLAGGAVPSYWYVYWVGPIAGAVIVGLLYRYAASVAEASQASGINTS
jgi:aquaporin Z